MLLNRKTLLWDRLFMTYVCISAFKSTWWVQLLRFLKQRREISQHNIPLCREFAGHNVSSNVFLELCDGVPSSLGPCWFCKQQAQIDKVNVLYSYDWRDYANGWTTPLKVKHFQVFNQKICIHQLQRFLLLDSLSMSSSGCCWLQQPSLSVVDQRFFSDLGLRFLLFGKSV